MRMKLTTDGAGRVTIDYDSDPWGFGETERVSRTFIAPDRFGYVKELTDNGTTQPCEALARTGNTLMASQDDLAATIRRAYRQMRRREKQALW